MGMRSNREHSEPWIRGDDARGGSMWVACFGSMGMAAGHSLHGAKRGGDPGLLAAGLSGMCPLQPLRILGLQAVGD